MRAYAVCDRKGPSGCDTLFVFKVSNRADMKYVGFGCKVKNDSFNYLVPQSL